MMLDQTVASMLGSLLVSLGRWFSPSLCSWSGLCLGLGCWLGSGARNCLSDWSGTVVAAATASIVVLVILIVGLGDVAAVHGLVGSVSLDVSGLVSLALDCHVGLVLCWECFAVGSVLLAVYLAGCGCTELVGVLFVACSCLASGWLVLDGSGSCAHVWSWFGLVLDALGTHGSVGLDVYAVVLDVKPLGEFCVTSSCTPS